MVSREEAVCFVTNVLGISSPLEKIAQDPHHFLKEYMPAFQVKIPFQTLSLISVKPHLRHRPNLEEIKKSILSGKGGLCYALNVFTKLTLEALGYDIVYTGSEPNPLHPNTHMITIVRNLKIPGDKYIVDVGIGCPCFEPIPLDFEDESPVYSQSFSQFKYVRRDGKIMRYHKTGSDPIILNNEGDLQWRLFYIMDEEPVARELSFFDEIMEDIYAQNKGTRFPFHHSLRIVAYSEDLKCVALKDSSLLVENELHHLEEVKLGSVEEVLEKVDLHFPLLSDAARKVVKNLKFEF